MLKVANTPKELEKYFYFNTVRDEHIIAQIEKKCELISESLNTYLQEQTHDEW